MPPSRSNLEDYLLIPSEHVVNKQIATATAHNNIPIFEIIPI